MFECMVWLRETDSTQEFIKRTGLPCGSVVVADRQKRGKGRKGRRWESQEGGLYFSFVLCEKDFREFAQIPLVVGLALSDFLDSLGVKSSVKWPNDVYVKGKKIAGVLVEKSGERIFVGVGLNVNQKELPEELRESATSIYIATGRELDRKEVLRELLGVFASYLEEYRKKGFSPFKNRIEEKLLFKGEEVILLSEEPEVGILVGLSKEGFLLLQTSKGIKKVPAGEVSLRLFR